MTKEKFEERMKKRIEFMGAETLDARNKFMVLGIMTIKDEILLAEYIRKLEKMTGLEFLQ